MISNQIGRVEYYDPFAEWIGQHIKNKKDNGLLGAVGEPR